MRIYLARCGTDKRISVEIEPEDTIQEVKIKAKAQKDPKLTFAFEGRPIENGRALSEYNVTEDSVLMMAAPIFLLVEKREEIHVDLTCTVGFTKALLMEKLKLAPGADFHLFLGDQELLDDGLSLLEAGVTERKTLRLLSRTIAEEHARLSKVYKIGLGDILKDGKASTGGNQEFPLDCPLSELAELGPGWPLFFDLGFFLAALCLVLFVLQLPLVVMFADASGVSLVATIMASPGSLGPHGSDSLLPGWCAHMSCVVLLLGALYYTHRQDVLRRELDDLEVEPMDYALLIHGMPGEAPDFWADESRVKEFVEGCLGEDGPRIEVVQVTLGYDIPRLQALLKDHHMLTQAEQDPDGTTPLLSCSLTKEEVANILTTPDLLRKELGCHSTCVVTLRWPEDLWKVLKKWDTAWEQILWALRGLGSICKTWGLEGEAPTFSEYSNRKKIDGRHPVRICRAGAPSDLLWENFGASFPDCFAARLRTNALMGGIFLIGFVLIWVAETVAGGRIGGAGWQVLLRCMTLIGVNMGAATLAKRCSQRELHLTKTDQDDSLMVKLAIYMAFNYTFLLIALYRDSGTSWYREGGLLNTVFYLMPCDTTVVFLLAYFGFSSHMALLVKTRSTPPLTTPGFTQSQYNKHYEPEELRMSRPLAHLMKSFLMFVFFLPFCPVGSLFMVLSLVLKTVGYKKQLLRVSSRPYRQSHIMAFSALNFVYVGVMVYAFSSWWFLSPFLTGAGSEALHSLSWVFVVLAAYLLAAPRWINSALGKFVHCVVRPALGCCLASPGDGTDPDSHDYYKVQEHWSKCQKYHTSSKAYLQLVGAMMAKKVPPPWDVTTGNLPVPDGAVGAAP